MEAGEEPGAVLGSEVVLPEPEDAPAPGAQRADDEPVAKLVGGEFLLPEGAVVDWDISVLGTGMPETAVHKNGQAKFEKNKVGFAEKWVMAPPAGDFVLLENFDERDFGSLVAVTANAGHHFGALFLGEDVGHGVEALIWRLQR
jgi:hypothetical protein